MELKKEGREERRTKGKGGSGQSLEVVGGKAAAVVVSVCIFLHFSPMMRVVLLI